MKYSFDIDIDLADRMQLLQHLPHIPACIYDDNGRHSKHNTGVYLQNIPTLPLEGFSAIDHKVAAEEGWFKLDFLNNHVYNDVKSEEHLVQLMNTEPMWEMLQFAEFVEQLFHVSKYHYVLCQHPVTSVEQLAMVLALIRPAKRHLMGRSWSDIERDIWTPPEDGSYYFKKAHAISYAFVIVVQMNLLCELVDFSD